MDERINDEAFEDWVFDAIDALPQVFRDQLGSVAIVIADWPTADQLAAGRSAGLYGLYQGVPRSQLSADHVASPSTITIFRGQLEAHYHDPDALRAKVVSVVRHEIAHHFGISDDRLHEIGRY